MLWKPMTTKQAHGPKSKSSITSVGDVLFNLAQLDLVTDHLYGLFWANNKIIPYAVGL